MHKVKCYNCNLTGHFAQDCRKPKQASSSGMHTTATGEQPKDKAQAWLRAVAEEDEEVKDAILQELIGDKDFQNT